MKKLGLFLSALTAVSFASCGGALNAPKDAAPERGAAAEPSSYTGYRFFGKNGGASVIGGMVKGHFTKETQQYLDPKYVGTDTVLETSIWLVDYARDARDQFEAAGIRTWDYSETSNPVRDCHFKFNMLNVTALVIK
jgi:hypothetical protein